MVNFITKPRRNCVGKKKAMDKKYFYTFLDDDMAGESCTEQE